MKIKRFKEPELILEKELYKSFNKQNLSEVRKKINEMFADFYVNTGIQFKMGNITFTENSFRAKLEGFLIGDKSSDEVEKIAFSKVCKRFGFDPSDYGMEFLIRGEKYILIGFNTRAPKNPFTIRQLSTGKEYRTGMDPRNQK